MDPLDGSSNIDVNISVGTIFGIYKRKSDLGTDAVIDDFCKMELSFLLQDMYCMVLPLCSFLQQVME